MDSGKSDTRPTRVPLPGGMGKSDREKLTQIHFQPASLEEELTAEEVKDLLNQLRVMTLDQLRQSAKNIHAAWRGSKLPKLDNAIDTLLFHRWWQEHEALDAVAQMERNEMLSWCAMWVGGSFPTIQLTHSAAAALALTDCSGVLGEEIGFPFENFLLQLPSPGGPIVFEDYDGTPVEGRWATVHLWHTIHGKAEAERCTHEIQALGQEFAFYKRQGRPNVEGEFAEALRALIQRAQLEPELVFRVWSAEGVSIHVRVWPLRPDESAEKWIELASDRSRDMATHDGVVLDKNATMPLTKVDSAALKALVRIVVNLCLYLDGNRTPGEPRVGMPHSIAPKSDRGEYGPMSWVVGKDLVLPHVLREAARDYSRRGKLPTQWRITKRFVVRGHWRWQAHGTKRALRRRRWIAPFWKGPERAEGLMRNIRVNA